jgi:hypothetical protein
MNPLLDELLAEVRVLDPDMVFLTGNLVCDLTSNELPVESTMAHEWDRLGATLGQLGVPIYRVPGSGDISSASYGGLPQAIRYRASLFLLLNSAGVREGDEPAPLGYSRDKPLDSGQVDFVRERLSEGEPYDHVFLFMHHVLWWSDDDPWWREVHPLLVDRDVRAVFSGDLGPVKFAHTRRDGIDYIQSGIEQIYAIENPRAVEWLRASEEARLLARQLDNYLYVTVDGPQVAIEVKTIGAMSSAKFSPQRFRDVHGDVWHRVEMPKADESLVERVWRVVGTPWRLTALALVMGICFLGGLTSAVVWNRGKAD